MNFGWLGCVVLVVCVLSGVEGQGDPELPDFCKCTMGNPCCWYVDPNTGWKNGTGTKNEPFSTIQAAVERASSGDTIYLFDGDYILSKSVVIAEMGELHMRALEGNQGKVRLIQWGIQIQATIGMISNITISDLIIESSSGLRVMGTVNDIVISRVSFLMIGPASEDVIKLDRVKLGGDGTNNESSIHGIRFIDCIFNTRNSVLVDKQNFFSWKQLVSFSSSSSLESSLEASLEETSSHSSSLSSNSFHSSVFSSSSSSSSYSNQILNNRVIFENTAFIGGQRGDLTIYFEDVAAVSFINSSFHLSALLSSNPYGFVFEENQFHGSGVYFTGNVSELSISRNKFLNFGPRNFPTLSHPSSITFRPYLPTNAFYESIFISNNTFTNFTMTSSDPVHGYAAILFLPPSSPAFSYSFANISIYYNDFSKLSLPHQSSSFLINQHDDESLSNKGKSDSSSDSLYESSSSSYQKSSLKDQKSTSLLQIKRNGPLAIYCDSGPIDARFNFYGDENGPSSCCNPDSSPTSPRVSPHLEWYPWCSDSECNKTKTVEQEDCYGCADQFPLMPVKNGDKDGTLVLVLIASTLATIIVIVGLTGLYCFTRPKSPELYSLVPSDSDGWRSRLLASVPDVQALFDQVGVPLINFHDLILNPIPIGIGSFGRVYDGVLTPNASHIQLHRELHTLMDNETLSKSTLYNPTSPTSPYSKSPPKPKKASQKSESRDSLHSAFQIRFGDEHSSQLSSFQSPTSKDPSSFSEDGLGDETSDSNNLSDSHHSDLLPLSSSSSSFLDDEDMHHAPSFVDTIVGEKRKKDDKEGKKKKTGFGGFIDKLKGKSGGKKLREGEGEKSGWDDEVDKKETKVKKSFFSKKSKKKEISRAIAVKELNSSITDSYEDMREFLEEIKIMASIDHPNILKLRGVAIDPITESILLVMDLMDLGSLDDVIFKRKIEMSYARKLAISTEVGYALHYLHSKEPAICHRDLKPGNVLVSKKWNVKVGDFGSSRVLDRKTATLTLKGTPIYLAPESINSSKFSEKSDVYSYGVTLVELFGSTRAFDDIDGSAANLMYRIATEGLRPSIPPNLPSSLKSLIRRCMATNPDDRPNFTDILEKLAEIRAASSDSSDSSSSSNPSSLVLDPSASSSSSAFIGTTSNSQTALLPSQMAPASTNASSSNTNSNPPRIQDQSQHGMQQTQSQSKHSSFSESSTSSLSSSPE